MDRVICQERISLMILRFKLYWKIETEMVCMLYYAGCYPLSYGPTLSFGCFFSEFVKKFMDAFYMVVSAYDLRRSSHVQIP
jgi:hypothetical protein